VARAQDTPDPLRLVSNQADVVVKVEQPRKIVEGVLNLELFRQVQELEFVKEYYDSTNYRRFLQLVAYFEKQLGVKQLDLLDELTGGGVVVASKIAQPVPVLLVVQGKNEKTLQSFVKLALKVVEQELQRQESRERPKPFVHRNVEGIQFGKDFHAVVLGSALVVSNQAKSIQGAIDLHLDGPAKSLAKSASVAEARKLLPPHPLAWGWLNFETVRKLPQAKDVLAEKQNDPNLVVLFGGILDVARRSSFFCAGVYQEKNGYFATFRFPSGREGSGPSSLIHVPSTEKAGSLPLLEPKGVLFSTSYHLDLGRLWEDRAKILTEQNAKAFEKADKSAGLFLGGAKLSKLLTQVGPHQRVVVVQQAKSSYKTVPTARIPAFAIVVDMRDPGFAKSMDTILRSAALLGGAQVGLELNEKKYSNTTIVGYRFPEDGKLKGDVNNIRFNFSPAFLKVGDQFVISSTVELARELVDLLQAEAKAPDKKLNPLTSQSKLYGSGGAALLKATEDQLLTQTILGQALAPKLAQEQVQALIDLVGRLGVLHIEENYGKNDWRLDLRWLVGK
jgi:hypothetical protein